MQFILRDDLMVLSKDEYLERIDLHIKSLNHINNLIDEVNKSIAILEINDKILCSGFIFNCKKYKGTYGYAKYKELLREKIDIKLYYNDGGESFFSLNYKYIHSPSFKKKTKEDIYLYFQDAKKNGFWRGY